MRPHRPLAPRWSASTSRRASTSRTARHSATPAPTRPVSGKIRFAVDPANARNQVIVGLDHAPRNAAGKVEFSADVAILRPKDPAKGNGTLLLDVVNRGNKTVLNSFDRAVASGHDDGFLMRRGFTLLWVGWEFDAPDGTTRIDVPALTDTHCRVRGAVTPNADAPTAAFGDVARYAPTEPESRERELVRPRRLARASRRRSPAIASRSKGTKWRSKAASRPGALTISSTKSRALRSPVSGSPQSATPSLGLGTRPTRT